jgi:hypothetical protein
MGRDAVRSDFEAGQPRKTIVDARGDPIRNVVGLRVLTFDVEWKHSNRIDRAGMLGLPIDAKKDGGDDHQGARAGYGQLVLFESMKQHGSAAG